jgi:hypothetical protein
VTSWFAERGSQLPLIDDGTEGPRELAAAHEAANSPEWLTPPGQVTMRYEPAVLRSVIARPDERFETSTGLAVRHTEHGGTAHVEMRPATHRMPNLRIVGETNNGKTATNNGMTALVNHFLAQYRPQTGGADTPSCIPIVAVQAPPLPDERRFYRAILAKVFAPFRPSKTAGNLQFEGCSFCRPWASRSSLSTRSIIFWLF